MKKVLILSYFFPPCNLTASQRAMSWVKHLPEFGYYPIVITRNWDNQVGKPADAYKKTGSDLLHSKFPDYEVYYLPYKPNLHNKILVRYSENRFVFVRKVLMFIELFFQNFLNGIIPYNNIFRFTRSYLQNNRDISKVIITANPFILFKWGFQLKKMFNIHWIADYRDDWNTQEIYPVKSVLRKQLVRVEKNFEKKWVGSSSHISSVSDYYVSKISKFVKRPGFTLLHGCEENKDEIIQPLYDEFTIVYSGTLYPAQNIEIFLKAFLRFSGSGKPADKIKLIFLGTGYDPAQKKRIFDYLGDFQKQVLITERISMPEAIEIQKKAYALLLVPITSCPGIPTSKLYEYIGLKKPVFLCPSDDNFIEDVLIKTGVGLIANSEDQAYQALSSLWEHFLKGESYPLKINLNEIAALSRRKQVEKLVKVLDSL